MCVLSGAPCHVFSTGYAAATHKHMAWSECIACENMFFCASDSLLNLTSFAGIDLSNSLKIQNLLVSPQKILEISQARILPQSI